MSLDDLSIIPASTGDLGPALTLLERANLPTAGAADHFAHFHVARRGAEVIGAAGVELYEDAALLRSVVVAEELRRSGLGLALSQTALDYAQRQGARMAYLLTETAAGFFGRKFGFATLPRHAVDQRLHGSTEFQGACTDTAVAMVRPLAESHALSLKERVRWALAGRTREVIVKPDAKLAAVLLLLYEKDGVPHVLFTQRTFDVEDHKGEVSFPGGAFHHGEDTSMLDTALRESDEEVGVPPENVEILGELDDLTTRANYLVTPYVGILREPQEFHPAAIEVARVLEIPLDFLQDPASHLDGTLHPRIYHGRQIPGAYVDYDEAVVFGATYRVLRQFLNQLGG